MYNRTGVHTQPGQSFLVFLIWSRGANANRHRGQRTKYKGDDSVDYVSVPVGLPRYLVC